MIFNASGGSPNAITKDKVVNNFTTTEEGYVADARALKALNDSKLSMELLWENASPSSEFAGQTISLDLNGYEAIYVITDQTSVYVKNSGWRNINGFEFYDSVRKAYVRSVDFLSNGVKFSDCRCADFKSLNTINTTNNFNKPTHIYGIKGVTT